MTDREKILRHSRAYLVLGDVDKPFHLPECDCDDCERWREEHDRPTHEEIRRILWEAGKERGTP